MDSLLLCMGSLIKGSSESIPRLSPVVPGLFRAAAALPGLFLSSQSQEQLLGCGRAAPARPQLAVLQQILLFSLPSLPSD